MDKFYRASLLLSIACASEDAAFMLQMGKVAPLAVAPLSQVRNCANGTDEVGCQRSSLVQGSVVNQGCSDGEKKFEDAEYRFCSERSKCRRWRSSGTHCFRKRNWFKCSSNTWNYEENMFGKPNWMPQDESWCGPFDIHHPLWTASLPNQGWCRSAEGKTGGGCRAPTGIFLTPDDCFNYELEGTKAVQFRGGSCDFYRQKGAVPTDCPEGFAATRGTDVLSYQKDVIENPSWVVFCKITNTMW